MTLATSLTRRLGIEHPVLLAPMDLVADAALTTAVSRAGGFGVLGGGYGDKDWLTPPDHSKAIAEGLPPNVEPFAEARDTRKLDDDEKLAAEATARQRSDD